MIKEVRSLRTNTFCRYIQLLAWVWIVLSPSVVYAEGNNALKSADAVDVKRGQKEYSYEVGAQLGVGYYLGDANNIPFLNSRGVLGAHIRYKIDYRWAIQLKAQRQCIAYKYIIENQNQQPLRPTIYQNPIWHGDVVCEFNFFKLGPTTYDYRIKTFSPYLFLGLGMSVLNKVAVPVEVGKYEFFSQMNNDAINVTFYLPIGIGFKWRIVGRWQLQIAWQHNIYLSDDIEGFIPGVDYKSDEELRTVLYGVLNNSHEMNGFNIFNNDVVSTLTIGVVYEFGAQKYKKYIHEPSATSARVRMGVYFE